MFQSKRRWLLALLTGFYLYFLLPATATVFYELYHLTGVEAVYWGYSGFKAAGYYFGVWKYQLVSCIAVTLAIAILPALFTRRKPHESA